MMLECPCCLQRLIMDRPWDMQDDYPCPSCNNILYVTEYVAYNKKGEVIDDGPTLESKTNSPVSFFLRAISCFSKPRRIFGGGPPRKRCEYDL